MKKQLTVALGLAVIATPALASKARLEALGEDNYGSYYIQDNRNIFLNPAKINETKDLVTFEFGQGNSNATATVGDSVAQPRAEGGVIKAHGNLVYGAHFGNSTPSAVVVHTLGGNTVQEQNPLDVFVGGDAGVKWGANLTYENFDGTVGTTRISSNGLRARLGALFGDTEAFGQVSFVGDVKDRTNNREVEGKGSYYVGVGHLLNGYKLFIDYKMIEADYGVLGTTASNWELSEWRAGVARAEKLNDRATLLGKIQFNRTAVEADTGTGGIPAAAALGGELESMTLPLTVGLEYDATSWLQLRASVIHTLWGTSELDPNGGTKASSTVASTNVRAGASLKFGEFSVDGLVGTTNDDDNTPAAANTVDTAGGNGGLRTDNLMTRVSMTYRF